MSFNVALETIAVVNNSDGTGVSVAHTVLEFCTKYDADQYILSYDRDEKFGYVNITRTATRLY